MTLRVRAPAVAGSFYPAEPATLLASVAAALEAAATSADAAGPAPKAIIVPHAGYAYSGPVAASAYARLVPSGGRVERVVLLGPAHRSPHTSIAVASAEAFQTPLGLLPVDCVSRDQVLGAAQAVVDDVAHSAEHSLEVQLPFLQVVLPEVHVLPLAVGNIAAAALAALLDTVWGGAETVVIVSTDLSHYHERRTAEQRDRRTARAIVDKQPEAIRPGDACGLPPLRGLLLVARQRHLDVELLDLRTSADTAGGDDAVVGYGAFALVDSTAQAAD